MRCGDLSFMKVSQTTVQAYRRLRGAEARLRLDGLFGFGGDVVSGVSGFIVAADALHAVLETFEPFTKTFAEFGQLFASEEDDNDDREKDQMPWLEQDAHTLSPMQPGARGRRTVR